MKVHWGEIDVKDEGAPRGTRVFEKLAKKMWTQNVN